MPSRDSFRVHKNNLSSVKVLILFIFYIVCPSFVDYYTQWNIPHVNIPSVSFFFYNLNYL